MFEERKMLFILQKSGLLNNLKKLAIYEIYLYFYPHQISVKVHDWEISTVKIKFITIMKKNDKMVVTYLT